MKQVDKIAYRFEKYCGGDRWASYHYQLKETLALQPKNILEIGLGDGVFGQYIERNTDVQYQSMDVAADLHPDIIGSVSAIPLPNASFDLVCAFEVLEHLPFEKFPEALREMSRVSKKHVLISLPHFGPSVELSCKIPFLPRFKWAFKIPYPREHRFDGQHYWEIGKRCYSKKRIREALRESFIIKKEFIPFENQYHHFFLLEKKA